MAENNAPENKGAESKPEYLKKIVMNLPVEVEITGGLFRGNYLTRIKKIIKNKDIFLDMPLQDGKVFKFWPHTVVHINFYFDNEPGAVYTFSARISKTGQDNRREIFIIPFQIKLQEYKEEAMCVLTADFQLISMYFFLRKTLKEKKYL